MTTSVGIGRIYATNAMRPLYHKDLSFKFRFAFVVHGDTRASPEMFFSCEFFPPTTANFDL